MPQATGDGLAELEGIVAWAKRWESRTKLIASIIFIFGVISLNSLTFVTVALLTMLITALAMGLKLPFILSRYLLIAPFILLMTIPMMLGGGFPLDLDRVTFASLIILKAVTSMTIMTVLLHTQTTEQFISSLAGLKVPPIIITVLLLSFRYVFMFIDDIQKMQLALKTRFFQGGLRLNSLKTYGHLIGCLLVKSLDRSENVYNAMKARCFNGNLQYTKKTKITMQDYVISSLFLLFISLLIVFEKVFFVSLI